MKALVQMATIGFAVVCFAVNAHGQSTEPSGKQGDSRSPQIETSSQRFAKPNTLQNLDVNNPQVRSAILSIAAAELGCSYSELASPGYGTTVTISVLPGGQKVFVARVRALLSLTDVVIIETLKFEKSSVFLTPSPR